MTHNLQDHFPTLKKDELWKPILRLFRKYVRTCLRADFELNNPLTQSGHIKRCTLLACQTFLAQINAPSDVIKSDFDILALVVILSRCQAKNLRSRFHLIHDRTVMRRLKNNFCLVFRENSAPMRKSFFSEPLIRGLWPQFIETERGALNAYF